MRLTAPKLITFLVSFIVAVIALLIAAKVVDNPLNTVEVVWIALVAYVILAVGNLVRGL